MTSSIPQLTRALARSDTALDRLDPADVVGPRQPLEVPNVGPDEYIEYRGLHKAEIERDTFVGPYVQDPAGVIFYYTKSVAKAGGVERIAGAFAMLAPMVRDYLQERVFDRPIDLADKTILRRLAENDAQQIVIANFQTAIRALAITEREATLAAPDFRVSDTPPFPWSRETVDGKRSVFNLTPVDNSLERRFAHFLDRATDVAAYAKLTPNSRFAVEYIAPSGAASLLLPRLRRAPRRRILPRR